ncbi:enoyl-CoA hydratase/isomerase [Geotalea daltonii FRC-32]|uniref:Enoyl-CoA hydratase/isomerase n=2 Tax=Geotalea TaxID=2910589 RepID=B9M429_GEODF|nr:enoyl-CoA hydratase/isomerase [Geotalea daltonii FRC-32]
MVFEDMALYNKLRLEVKNRVGFMMMDSGARFNKLTINMLKELKHGLAELQASDEAACIVLSGYPGESFAVGADIGQMVKFDSQHAFAFAELGQSLFAAMESCTKPIIGALNGITMGGGCDLSLACDLRIASDALRFAHPGAKLGILTGFCGTQKLPRLLGRNFANEIFMTSDVYGPEDALRMGYVNCVHPADIFWPEVVAFAERIAANPAPSLGYAKKAINAAEDCDLKNGCILESGLFSALFPLRDTSGSCKEKEV